jgi:hypothetical protein
MWQVVHKFPLYSFGHNEVPLPEGAQVLTVQMQDDVPTLWALCHPSSPVRYRKFTVVGTGQAFAQPVQPLTYVGTVQTTSGLAWHIFEGQL